MKLSEDVLAEGRSLVTAQDLDGLVAWSARHAPTVSPTEIKKTFELLFKAGDTGRALKLFEAFYPQLDPAKDLRKGLLRLGCLAFVALGALGGVVYLFQTIF